MVKNKKKQQKLVIMKNKKIAYDNENEKVKVNINERQKEKLYNNKIEKEEKNENEKGIAYYNKKQEPKRH